MLRLTEQAAMDVRRARAARRAWRDRAEPGRLSRLPRCGAVGCGLPIPLPSFHTRGLIPSVGATSSPPLPPDARILQP
jgi:hypothetical protein